MTEFETKDSGTHLEYESGMRRDSQDGKPRFDLIRTKRQPYEEQMIYRYAMLLARGAEKYSARNWEDGDSEEEMDRAKASLLRHAEQLVAGETDEDHAAAVWFNAQAVEYFRWRIAEKAKSPTTTTLDFIFEPGESGSKKSAGLWAEEKGIDVRDWDGIAPMEVVTEEDFWSRIYGCTILSTPTTDDVVLGFDGSKSDDTFVVADRGWTWFPPAAQEMIAKAFDEASKAWTDPNLKRPDDWLKKYGINLLAGDLGDSYTTISYAEFRDRLNKCTWQQDARFPRPPKRAGDLNEFGDVYCPNDLEATNNRCWKCGWVRPLDQGDDKQ